jgi:hypothetical protein
MDTFSGAKPSERAKPVSREACITGLLASSALSGKARSAETITFSSS